jgi:hypothetical protein
MSYNGVRGICYVGRNLGVAGCQLKDRPVGGLFCLPANLRQRQPRSLVASRRSYPPKPAFRAMADAGEIEAEGFEREGTLREHIF